ncbi:uncharacterized protein FOMMEDRAFT_105365 [Fomitiporia mediterranea MF3/22]|uniref:uncharacterized protein n=1 Tax=Fomitiporia mediterranea (strain MF3/22) TaxID=694068 RepID=UPI0004408DC1|nr:uncharacterized protein FOMMEDRAFT_105365 [Fomitiporia mediterranea MF3/22]EJD05118.1 hypothetical protein FOMMEDRAFT_105365 [Fomitiporia mediterranea MF3/22]
MVPSTTPLAQPPTPHLSSGNSKIAKYLLPSAYREHLRLADSLRLVVTRSSVPSCLLVGETSLALSTKNSWLKPVLWKGALDKLFAAEHMGNYVIIRTTGQKVFEIMPLYARIGMHLLFYGPIEIRFVRWRAIRNLLKTESIRQGKIYDSTDRDVVRGQIASFIETYHIDLSELAQPDLTTYKTFNEFFSRKLRPRARLPASPNDCSVIVSPSDCRLTVWPTWESSRKIWVKGRRFTLRNLVKSRSLARALGARPSLAICRLAPQDYHRFHSPVKGLLVSTTHIPGDYYTVNPQAVNEDLDVFTANTRSIAVLQASIPLKSSLSELRVVPIVVVAVGALLVGSIGWDKKQGEMVEKGDGLGYFKYGGSTVICIFPEGVIWDGDLVQHSEEGIEVLVRAGEKIGTFP